MSATTDPRLNGASYPITLRRTVMDEESGESRVEERTFNLTPMSDRDMTELDNWLQAEYVRLARASLPDFCTPEERQETIQMAISKAMTLTFLSGEGAKIMGTVQGMARLIWTNLKRHHPDVSFEELKSYMYDPANIKEANETWRNLNLGPRLPKGDKGGEAPGKSEPGKRKRRRRGSRKR